MLDRNRVARWLRLALLIGVLALLALPGAAAAQSPVFPDLIALPTGFAPEGVASGRGTAFFTGSLSGMGIYRGDLRTGQGAILTAPEGRVYTGMKVDQRSNYLFVSGGPSGQAYVYDAETGAELAVLQLAASGTSFINDVVLTRDAAYFTNSYQPYFYRLALGPAGEVAPTPVAEPVMLTGEWQQGTGFGANGIDATPDGRYLIIVNSSVGTLYRVDPVSGYATEIDLGGASVTAGDGILLLGKTLYVVRNELNQIAVFELSPDYLSAQLVDVITDSDFQVPTTIATFGDSLYAVNARFGTPVPGTSYDVVRVTR